ncbi:alpha/beta fold hydrolase [Promicromonospora iranensis]|jgi:pimeloyl-ACP methyl ester carboxylesterase|uniref:alpha/beta fold hydrolase n=1 Tax=Promicromonospora iranensis TaxID=1105144 RepID=UPI0023A97708|nr:alpha/beta fold hydrolase [Promicromonospora iranensis]
MTDKKTFTLEVPSGVLTYDVREPAAPTDERPLVLIGLPMGAEGFTTLASHFTDRTVVTYDPRGVERSTRDLDTETELPGVATHAEDVHRVIETVGGGPVDLFASSGGAMVALELAAAYPEDVRTVVAHEPPLASVLPDREAMAAAMTDMHDTYQAKGFGAAMAKFITVLMAEGELTADHADQPDPDPAAFGLPTEDDGSRDDLMFGVNMLVLPPYEPRYEALASGAPRVVIAVGADTGEQMTGRAARGAAERLGTAPVVFPGGHGGFSGGEYGQPADKPVEFATTLREVLAG